MSNKLRKKSKPVYQKQYVSPVRLSQCMIVKNEEENIEKALSWAKNIAFEQIVVDTGSTDKTVEIAQKMGAKVYHFEWINDFSAAKNFAIEQAKGDWIAFLDADEYMTEKNASALYEVLIQKSLNKETMPDIIRTSLTNIEENGEFISKILQDRIFRNVKGLRYQGQIHENIAFEDDRITNILILDSININHTGYQQRMKIKKGDRNITMLREILQKNPNDYHTKSYLADSLYIKGENEEAYEMYHDCLQNIEKIKNSARNYSTFKGIFNMISSSEKIIHKDVTEIIQIYESFQKSYSQSPDPDFYLGIYYYNYEDYDSCIAQMKKAIAKLETYVKNPLYNCTCTLSGIQLYLGYSYFNLNQYHEALPNLIRYQKDNNSNSDSLIKLLYIIQQQNLPEEELLRFMLQILKGLYRLSDLRDNLICIKAAKILGLNKLAEALKSYLSKSDLEWLEA